MAGAQPFTARSLAMQPARRTPAVGRGAAGALVTLCASLPFTGLG
jgi:hypothetical protein